MNRINLVLLQFLFLLACSTFKASTSEQIVSTEREHYETTTTAIGLPDRQVTRTDGNGTGKGDWETGNWSCPERLKQWFPVYRLGTDDDGLAVYLSMNGRYNFKKLLEEGTGEETGAVDKYFDSITDNFTRDDKASGGNGVISIIDWDGFSIRNYNSPAVIRLAVKQFGKLGKIYNAIKQTYSINTNFAAETFLNAAKPQLGKMLEKLQVYGTRKEKWMPELRRLVPQHLLPTKYGGTNDRINL